MEGQLKKSLPTQFPHFAEKETKGYLSSFCWLAAKWGASSAVSCRWGKAKGLGRAASQVEMTGRVCVLDSWWPPTLRGTASLSVQEGAPSAAGR